MKGKSFVPWILGIYLVALSLFYYIHRAEMGVGDSDFLVRHSVFIKPCIFDGDTNACTKISYFPLFQNLIAFAMTGFSHTEILLGFSLTNFILSIFVIGSGYYFYSSSNVGRTANSVWLLFLLTSPLYSYFASSWGEMGTASFLLFFYLACRQKKYSWMFLFAFLTGITKEIAGPFILLIALFAGSGSLWKRKQIPYFLVVFLGLLVSVIANGIFNFIRYQSVLNQYQMNPDFIVSDLQVRFIFFLGLFYGINGGLFIFWFVFTLLLGFFFYLPFRSLSPRLHMFYKPAIAAVYIGILHFGLSGWFSPFGSAAYGTRLSYPWVPALGMAMIADSKFQILAFLQKILSKKTIPILIALILIFSLPNLFTLFNPGVLGDFLSPDNACPKSYNFTLEKMNYYDCYIYGIWEKTPLLWMMIYKNIKWEILNFVLIILYITVVTALLLDIHLRNLKK